MALFFVKGPWAKSWNFQPVQADPPCIRLAGTCRASMQNSPKRRGWFIFFSFCKVRLKERASSHILEIPPDSRNTLQPITLELGFPACAGWKFQLLPNSGKGLLTCSKSSNILWMILTNKLSFCKLPLGHLCAAPSSMNLSYTELEQTGLSRCELMRLRVYYTLIAFV